MEKDEKYKKINGAEGSVVHNGKLILGLQKEKRWYNLLNHERVGIIKTIGGAIEEEDNGSSMLALKREIKEEIKDLEEEDIKITSKPIFCKDTTMSKLNKYENKSDLKMEADFYVVEITKKEKLEPNDLPALIEIPVEEFLKIAQEEENIPNNYLEKYILEHKEKNINLPEKYTMMIPNEVTNFLVQIKNISSNDIKKREFER